MIKIEREMVSHRLPGGYFTKRMAIKIFNVTAIKLTWTYDGK